MSCGFNPVTGLFRNRMNVEISAPNRRHSDPRKAHIPSLTFDNPVLVGAPCSIVRSLTAIARPYSAEGSRAHPYRPSSRVRTPSTTRIVEYKRPEAMMGIPAPAMFGYDEGRGMWG